MDFKESGGGGTTFAGLINSRAMHLGKFGQVNNDGTAKGTGAEHLSQSLIQHQDPIISWADLRFDFNLVTVHPLI